MKRAIILAILLAGCHTREDISKREKCLFHDYQKLPYCKNYRFLPADKTEKKAKIIKDKFEEKTVAPLKYSKIHSDQNYELIFDAEPLLAN
jgi:hypothetical protein